MQRIDIQLIDKNEGQLEGLPANPRFIRDEKFKKLVESVKKDPELLQYRGILVFPYEGRFIAIGGNQRLEACREAKMKDVPCEILPENTPLEKLKAFALKDNSSYGEWDFALIESTDWLDFIKNDDSLDLELPASMEKHIAEGFTSPEKSISLDYTVFFDTKEECDMFYDFLSKLRETYPNTTNVSKRLLAWVASIYEENEELTDSQRLLRLIKIDMDMTEDKQNTEDVDYEQFKSGL